MLPPRISDPSSLPPAQVARAVALLPWRSSCLAWPCCAGSRSLKPRPAAAYAEDVHFQLAMCSLDKTALNTPASPGNLAAAAAVRSAIDSHAGAAQPA